MATELKSDCPERPVVTLTQRDPSSGDHAVIVAQTRDLAVDEFNNLGSYGCTRGEMRIPALLYLFGIPIVEAGTLSLAVSVPTVAAGAFTDRRIGRIPGRRAARSTLLLEIDQSARRSPPPPKDGAAEA